MNKYHKLLKKVLDKGKHQQNNKGSITYLLNETLNLKPADLLEIFEGHGIARNKLKTELQLFQQGERLTERYREAGINWWDYCGPILVNSYPTYFEKLPGLIQFQIDRDKLVVSAYQRSSDANLGLPADIYHLYLISRQIELPLKSITLYIGNAHIYQNNIEKTKQLLEGQSVKFELNV